MTFRDFKIEQKLTAVIMLTSGCALLLLSIVLVTTEIRNLRRNLLNQVTAVASVIATNSAAALAFEDQQAAQQNLLALKEQRHVAIAALHRSDGAIFAHYGRDGDESGLDGARVPGWKAGELDHSVWQVAHLDTFRRIVLDGDELGYLYVRSDLNQIYAQSANSIFSALAILLGMLGFTFLLARRTRRFISTPIVELAGTMDRISHDKDYSRRMASARRDEIGSLIGSFNAMLQELEGHEANLRDARARAEAANRAKSAFLANMSHELRTPLNAVIGFSEIIKDQIMGRIENATYVDYAGDINKSAKHLLKIINEILDMARIEAGRVELEIGDFEIGEIIGESLRVVRGQAEAKRIDLSFSQKSDRVWAPVDEQKVKQIMLNLLSNAIKFTPDGGRVSVLLADDARNHVMIRVSDTGIGIAAEDLERVMQPFGQVETALSRKYDGTGLGLTLTKALVDLHGGSLQLLSTLGEGTTAVVTLPRRSAMPVDQPPQLLSA